MRPGAAADDSDGQLPTMAWATFTGEPPMGGGVVRLVPIRIRPPPVPAPVAQAEVKGANDAGFVAATQATLRLQPPPQPLAELQRKQLTDKSEARKAKKRELGARKRDRLIEEHRDYDGPLPADDDDEANKVTVLAVPPMRTRRVVPAGSSNETTQDEQQQLPIYTLEAYKKRDHELALFAQNMERTARAANDTLVYQPPETRIVAFCGRNKARFPWFVPMMRVVAESQGQYDVPDVPALRRSQLIRYMRAPDPRCPWERPCMNLGKSAGRVCLLCALTRAQKTGIPSPARSAAAATATT